MSNPSDRFGTFRPTPPQRGSFPLDHFGDCTEQMQQYLKCLRLVKNDNAPNCRLLAKNYLDCRMNHELMERVEWKDLGLPEEAKSASERSERGDKGGEEGAGGGSGSK